MQGGAGGTDERRDGEGAGIDVGEIWRRWRWPIILVGLLTAVTFALFVAVVVGLAIELARLLAAS
ncbi:MAG: hypothetical protein KatS3mg119_0576 [Rhodothalassiaceae bacterium]|nr:MAG: hypothetical protein KatS3mg119_0576 [Rhodothalassiaceae bacterium]